MLQPIEERQTDQVVVERGTVPVDDLFEKLRAASCNDGAVDLQRLLAGQPQVTDGPCDGFELYKVGDARVVEGHSLWNPRLATPVHGAVAKTGPPDVQGR